MENTMESVASIVETVHVGAGILLNCLLLFAIRRFSKSIGSYKQLLTAFASFDVFLTTMHALVQPRLVIAGRTTFGVVSVSEDRAITSVYVACFTVPFALMIIHFLYRFWSIRHPDFILLFSNKKFVIPIASYPIAAFITWFLMAYYACTGQGEDPGKDALRAETLQRFGKEFREGWLIMNHWENDTLTLRPFITLIGGDLIMGASFSLAFTLCALTFYHIKNTPTVSAQSRNLQLKFFTAACAQTAVPVIFVYIPYGCCINFPLLNLPIYFLDDACMMLTSCFPAWDALVIIMLMKDFRLGLLGMFKKKNVNQAVTVFMSTSNAQSMSSSNSQSTSTTLHY